MLTAKGRLKKTLLDEVVHPTIGEGGKSPLSQSGVKIKQRYLMHSLPLSFMPVMGPGTLKSLV